MEIRAPLMVSLTIFSIIQLALGIWVSCSLSSNTGTVKNTYWSHIDIDGAGEIWSSLNTVVINYNYQGLHIDTSGSWDHFCAGSFNVSQAVNQSDANPESCNNCMDANAAFHITAVTNTLSKLGQLATDMTRSRVSEDVPCQKFVGLFSALGGGISTIYMLLAYSDYCAANIPDKFDDGEGGTFKITTTYGPGFILTLFITIGGLLDGFAHVLVPCPEECAESGYFYKRYGWPEYQKKDNDQVTI